AKQRLAGVTQEELALARPSTAPHALVLAGAIRRQLGADWAVGETGATGPTGNRYGDPAGHVALGVAGPVERSQVVETGVADRRQNMEAFTQAALRLLADALAEAARTPDPASR